MPIFDYQCKACGHTFDVLQRLSEDPLKDCPECGKPELGKLLSAPNIAFKGSGWNKTAERDKPTLAKQFGHTFDSATPHGDHDHDHGHGHSHGHSHDHDH